jgi:hypothetical protein
VRSTADALIRPIEFLRAPPRNVSPARDLPEKFADDLSAEFPCESNSFHRVRLQSCLMRLVQTARSSAGRPELFAIYIRLSPVLINAGKSVSHVRKRRVMHNWIPLGIIDGIRRHHGTFLAHFSIIRPNYECLHERAARICASVLVETLVELTVSLDVTPFS